MNVRPRPYRFVLAVSTAVLLGVSTLPASAECRADIHAVEEDVRVDNDVTRHIFNVEVRSTERCAFITFRLTTSETSPDGQTSTRYVDRRVRVLDGSVVAKVNYDRPTSNTLNEWHVAQTACETCPSN